MCKGSPNNSLGGKRTAKVTPMPEPHLPVYKSENVGGAAVWAKSSFSGTTNCVEVMKGADHVLVRHSQNPDGLRLCFTLAEWAAFLAGVRLGEFDVT
jgi:Domain of unknown function (DUF397)